MGNKNQTASSKSVRNHQYHHNHYGDTLNHHNHQQDQMVYGGQYKHSKYETSGYHLHHHHQQHQQHQQQKENLNNNNSSGKKNSIKRHLSSSSRNLVNRSSSSPVIANKWRLSQMDPQQNQQHQKQQPNFVEEICTLTRFANL